MKKISDYLPAMPTEQQEKINNKIQTLLKDPYIYQFMSNYQLSNEVLLRSLSQILAFKEDRDYFLMHGTSKQLPGYEPRLELVHGEISVKYYQTKADFQAQKEKEMKKSAVYIDIPKASRKASFDQLKGNQEKLAVVQEIYTFINQYLQNKEGYHQGIYLYGSYGVGKTYLMGALANELAKHQVKTVFVNIATFIAQLKGEFSQPQNKITQKLDQLKKADVLILDDIGMETMSEWVRDEILGVILQYRMQEELPTFFTSNLSMKALERHLAETRQEQNDLRAKRLMERISYLAKEMTVSGQSLR